MGFLRTLSLLLGVSVMMTVFACGAAGLMGYRIVADDRLLLHEQAQESEKGFRLIQDAVEVQSAVQRLIREQDIDAIEKLIARQDKLSQEVRQGIAELQNGGGISSAFEALLVANAKVREAFLKGDSAIALQFFIEESNPQFEKLLAAIQEYQQNVKTRIQQRSAEIDAGLKRSGIILILALTVAFIGYIIFGLKVRHSIARGMQAVATLLTEVSRTLRTAVGDMISASEGLAQGSCEEAASLEQTTSSMTELDSMAKSALHNAEEARECGSETRKAAEDGEVQVTRMTEAMDAIKHSSDEVEKIVKVIDEIAFQTNLLSLNAAVEAARAGEAGTGFAVVAAEVRNLAQRSATSARETSEKIADSISKANTGVTISREVAATFTQILERVRKIDGLIGEIVSASREQTQGISQIDVALIEIDKATQTTAASADELSTSAGGLGTETERLEKTVTDLESLLYGKGAGAKR